MSCHTSFESTATRFYGVLPGPDMPPRYVESSRPTAFLSLSPRFTAKQLAQGRAVTVSPAPAPSLGLRISASLKAGDRIPRSF